MSSFTRSSADEPPADGTHLSVATPPASYVSAAVPGAPARWQPTPFKASSDGSAGPASPFCPAGPAGPVGPRAPASPLAPATPAGPAGPAGPAEPFTPREPAGPCRFQASADSPFLHELEAATTRTEPLFFFTHALMSALVWWTAAGAAAKATPATRASGSATSATRRAVRRMRSPLDWLRPTDTGVAPATWPSARLPTQTCGSRLTADWPRSRIGYYERPVERTGRSWSPPRGDSRWRTGRCACTAARRACALQEALRRYSRSLP